MERAGDYFTCLFLQHLKLQLSSAARANQYLG